MRGRRAAGGRLLRKRESRCAVRLVQQASLLRTLGRLTQRDLFRLHTARLVPAPVACSTTVGFHASHTCVVGRDAAGTRRRSERSRCHLRCMRVYTRPSGKDPRLWVGSLRRSPTDDLLALSCLPHGFYRLSSTLVLLMCFLPSCVSASTPRHLRSSRSWLCQLRASSILIAGFCTQHIGPRR